ncbi:MAG: phenylalanine--tRNA ligase subunit beta [Candidatus Methanoplasma sp.]|jgi:phenylalanyl-tRNA synthetase beta chain|nr:phenylalanine--tRNA ligase subunit beta [Candidatus Methanoplasma sp.]
MPVINFSYGDLCSLLGEKVPQETLVERIPLIGADMHDTEGGADEMSVEFFPDRPDLFSVEGLARSLRAFLSIETGLKEYPVREPSVRAVVDGSVRGIRPFFSCAIVRDITIDDALLRSMMELQEKLHMTIGRKRSKFAIGIHDLDRVVPPFRYSAVPAEDICFVPLAMTEPMSPERILSENDKGREYAHLLKGCSLFPIITDANGDVLSFPPIINGSLTTVKVGSRNLFIDVTGTDAKAVKGALDIVATALAERGGSIEAVILDDGSERISPDLTPAERSVSVSECEKFLGISLGPEGMEDALRKMGMDASASGDSVNVRIPATRLDIMHTVDVFEDAAVGYGFERFGGKHGMVQTAGRLSPETSLSESLRDVLIGLGFTEVTTLTLSNPKDEFTLSGLPEMPATKVLNPITEDHTCLRSHLMPSLMRILKHNKHRDLPQRIFEIGYVLRDHRISLRLCALHTASKTTFTEIKSVSEGILREMRADHSIEASSLPAFVDGRGASVISEGSEIGIFGELSPKVITDFEMTHPVLMLEFDLSAAAGRAGSLF